MDETRALLDALMGPSRNEKKDAAGKGGEPDFVNRGVCKNFLVGFCPHDWFTTNRRQMKPCYKIHSDVMKEQFEKHPETEKYRVEWEEDFLLYLEVSARECDAYIAREKPKCRQRGCGIKDINMPAEAKNKSEEMETRYAQLIRKSEETADESLSRSQEYMQQALVLKEEMDALKGRHSSEFPGEDVCEICGVKYLLGGADKGKAGQGLAGFDKTDHMRGKTHKGYEEIREKIFELKGKKKQWEKLREKHKDWFKAYVKARTKESEDGQQKEREEKKEKERKEEKARRERERSRSRKEREARSRSRKERTNRRKDRDRRDRRGSPSPRNKKRGKSKDRKKGRGSPSPDVEVVDLPTLWARIGEVPEEEREDALCSLQDEVRDALEEWLVARMRSRPAV